MAVVSGLKVIKDLCQFLVPSKILISKEYQSFWPETDLYFVTDEIINKIVKLSSHEGIIAEFKIPNPNSLEGKKRILACDKVADPGNLGTLLRSALAFDFEAVFLLSQSCDLFNDKVIRSSRGASFLLPYRFGTFDELKALSLKNDLKPLVADLKGEQAEGFQSQERLVLLLGNESVGPSVEAKKWGEAITIGISEKMESLNVAVAGSILMYALQRR